MTSSTLKRFKELYGKMYAGTHMTEEELSELVSINSLLESKLARIEYQEKYQSDQVMTPLNGLLELQRISIQHTKLVNAIQDLLNKRDKYASTRICFRTSEIIGVNKGE